MECLVYMNGIREWNLFYGLTIIVQHLSLDKRAVKMISMIWMFTFYSNDYEVFLMKEQENVDSVSCSGH